MAITVQPTPATLRWIDFRVVPQRMRDPNDGSEIDAYTSFSYNLPAQPPRAVEGYQFALADPMVIAITPDAQVWSGVQQTLELLTHEQFHYDVGIVTARALARALMKLRAPSLATLGSALNVAGTLHLHTRARLLQRRYDLDCQHGRNLKVQSLWKERMRVCLADPNATMLGGFWL